MPFTHGVVAQHDAMTALMDLADVTYARKKGRVMGERLIVVIAGNEMNVAVQLLQVCVGAFGIPETEIAEMIDRIVGSDTFVQRAISASSISSTLTKGRRHVRMMFSCPKWVSDMKKIAMVSASLAQPLRAH